jgi:hypothetical protein
MSASRRINQTIQILQERQVLLDGSLSSCARSDPCERMTILTGSLSCIPGVCSDGA